MFSGVTGRWWKGIPYQSARGLRSGWLETMAATSILISPVRWRYSRSSRQWSNLDTAISTLGGVRVSCICHSRPSTSATAAKVSCSTWKGGVSPGVVENTARI
ncbi:hypothetical protein D3C71_1950080 [compost metagenome]